MGKMIERRQAEEERNKITLKDFVKYCQEHPQYRFWQALRNWSGYLFIFGSNGAGPGDLEDTFFKEGK